MFCYFVVPVVLICIGSFNSVVRESSHIAEAQLSYAANSYLLFANCSM